jgi:hypothetical protein
MREVVTASSLAAQEVGGRAGISSAAILAACWRRGKGWWARGK